MTNVTGGRIYTNYEWKLKDSAPVYSAPRFPERYTQTATLHCVHNGMWVMERPGGWNWLIGVDKSEVETLTYNTVNGVRYTIYFSPKPFGFIGAEEDDVDQTVYPHVIKPEGRKILSHARQIHKGELARTVHIPRLKYVRQAFAPGTKGRVVNARERRRSNLGWVRLTDLLMAADLTTNQLVDTYWQYSGHRNYRFSPLGFLGGQLLDIVIARSEAQITGKCPEVLSIVRQQASQHFAEHGSEIWVRRGFANTVLRLQALGIRPDVVQYA